MMILDMKCPICGAECSYALTKDTFEYFQCGKCEFLFHRSERTKDRESTLPSYDDRYWQMERAEAFRREREDCYCRALELIYLSRIGVQNILDFGCGLGVTVNLLREVLGLNAVGIDPSGEFDESSYLHKFDLEELPNRYPQGYFDAIYSIEVFEHLEDPKGVLSSLNYLLKPGGRILINTGTQEYIRKYDPDSNYIDPARRGHISIYSLKSFTALGSSLGLNASFLAARKYVVMMGPPEQLRDLVPHPRNLETIRRMGDWFFQLFNEYLRLVFLEGEFEAADKIIEQRTHWAKGLEKEVSEQREFIARLQKEFDDRGRWALDLDREVNRLRELNVQMRSPSFLLKRLFGRILGIR